MSNTDPKSSNWQFLTNKLGLGKMFYKLAEPRGRFFVSLIEDHISKEDTVLDIGSGPGNIAAQLLEKGYKVTPLDIRNMSFTKSVVPVIYDGKTMPFKDQAFDVALIITVLHHVAQPGPIIDEAKRVAHRVIIIEDIYLNPWHKYLTYFFDSLLNLEFKGHPHSNRNDREWKEYFERKKLKVVATSYSRSFIVFRHAMYLIEPM